MHDVLAHRLSLIALHTGVLANRADALPGPVVERLALLRTASTEALTDLRDVLGALRDTGTGPVQPPPGRCAMSRAHRAGTRRGPARRARRGRPPEQAPAAHRLAVFRLVQEALTNARKHAGDAPVPCTSDYGPPATVVEVHNTPGTHASARRPVRVRPGRPAERVEPSAAA